MHRRPPILNPLSAASAASAAAAAGLIANAPQQVSLQQLQQLIDIFGFDVVVVLDHPSLSHDLAGLYGHVFPDTAEEAAAQQQQQQLLLQRQLLGTTAGTPLQRVEVVSLPKLEGTVAVCQQSSLSSATLCVLTRLGLFSCL